MPSPQSKDTSTTTDHSAGLSTNKSPQNGTESQESKVPSAKRLDDPQEGSDRNYHCKPNDKCPGTRGFAKETGLRRHEREVHEMHGGPKEMLLCTEPGCRRNSGKRFKRQENLAEHRRRVHGDGNSKLQTIARATVAMVTEAPQRDCESDIKQLWAESSAMNDRLSRLEEFGDSTEKRLAKAEEMLAGKSLALEGKVSARSIVGVL